MIRIGGTLFGVLAVWAGALHLGPASAQEATFFSGSDAPTVEDYLKEVGPEAKLIPFDKFKIDGRSVVCGRRPVILNSNFDCLGWRLSRLPDPQHQEDQRPHHAGEALYLQP